MAASSTSLSNFLSFIFPSKPPPPPKIPPPQLTLPQTQKPREGLVPLVAQENPHSSSSLASVICPSLAYANTLYFNSAYNVQVVVEDNESEERLLNRFRREVMRAGVIQECKRRRFFENKQDEKKRRTREAAKRNKRRFCLLLSDFCFTNLLLLFSLGCLDCGRVEEKKD
jgi:ribosomal protein S21